MGCTCGKQVILNTENTILTKVYCIQIDFFIDFFKLYIIFKTAHCYHNYFLKSSQFDITLSIH